ncbi:MAG: hypothetical protein J5598_02410 [Clostridia bacterium]|nr:hypothetical protein [Clostridia bacterium]
MERKTQLNDDIIIVQIRQKAKAVATGEVSSSEEVSKKLTEIGQLIGQIQSNVLREIQEAKFKEFKNRMADSCLPNRGAGLHDIVM